MLATINEVIAGYRRQCYMSSLLLALSCALICPLILRDGSNTDCMDSATSAQDIAESHDHVPAKSV